MKDTTLDGVKIYHYRLGNGEFTVKEGIIRVPEKKGSYSYIEFDYGRLPIPRFPRMDEIGMVRSGGPSLWLFDRDDEFAKEQFLKYEEECIKKLEEDLEKRRARIEIIKKGV
jgi:hypothetical protein